MIRLDRVTKRFPGGRRPALAEVELTVDRREFVVLLGESGSGKTTTIKLMNRLLSPTAGRVIVAGDDVADVDPVRLRRRIGYVFQGVGLFPHLTVAENTGIVPALLGWDRARTAARVDEVLTLVGLPPADFGGRDPRALSGGERQRVGVARALCAGPRLLLMDEPFGALDPVTRDVLQDEVRRLHETLELTTVMVTHDVPEALRLADRVVVLWEGRIVGDGPPADLLRRPGHPYVEALLATYRRQSARLHELLDG